MRAPRAAGDGLADPARPALERRGRRRAARSGRPHRLGLRAPRSAATRESRCVQARCGRRRAVGLGFVPRAALARVAQARFRQGPSLSPCRHRVRRTCAGPVDPRRGPLRGSGTLPAAGWRGAVMTDAFPSFEGYFEAVHGGPPYAWQSRLVREAMIGRWPAALAVPTGAGKTAAIDVALYRLAADLAADPAARRAPMRIAFAVDRRVIVDQAYGRACAIKRALEADDAPSVLRAVRRALSRGMESLSMSPSCAAASPVRTIGRSGRSAYDPVHDGRSAGLPVSVSRLWRVGPYGPSPCRTARRGLPNPARRGASVRGLREDAGPDRRAERRGAKAPLGAGAS